MGLLGAGWLVGGMSLYGLATVVGGAGQLARKQALKTAGYAALALAFVFNAVLIGMMWVALDRPPFKTLYETLLLYPLCIAIVSLVLVAIHRLWVLVPFAAAGALVCLWYALRRPDLELIVLPPALQSAWFVPHVVTYFIAYAGLFVAFVLAALALLGPLFRARRDAPAAGEASIPLEDGAHKAVVFGFFALTLGLAMGAAWGKSAWGDYWQWDPKENWAFITWLAYLGYLHLRLVSGWRGKRVLWLNLACFAAVLFTYLGMHLLPTADGSMHVYQ